MSTQLIESIAGAIDSVVPPEVDYIGFVPQDYAGQFLVIEPTNHPGGTTATWSKVKRYAGEQPHRALLRCYYECLGGHIHSIFPIPFCWAGRTGISFYFTGVFHGGTPPTSAIRSMNWLSYTAARSMLAQSNNLPARKRDLGLLVAAQQVCPTSTRRILLMVSELHKMGFERLRIAPHIGPTGFAWRCDIVPATCISERHGALLDYEAMAVLHRLLGESHYTRYTSGFGFEFDPHPFGWKDAMFDSPRVLAEKFMNRFSGLTFAGFGRDSAYVAWYERMLEQTAPIGLVASFSDGPSPMDYDYLESHLMADVAVRIPVPPPPVETGR